MQWHFFDRPLQILASAGLRTSSCARTRTFVLNAPLPASCPTGALSSPAAVSCTHQLYDQKQRFPLYCKTATCWFNFLILFLCTKRKSSFFRRLPHSPLALLSVSLLNIQIKSISVICSVFLSQLFPSEKSVPLVLRQAFLQQILWGKSAPQGQKKKEKILFRPQPVLPFIIFFISFI